MPENPRREKERTIVVEQPKTAAHPGRPCEAARRALRHAIEQTPEQRQECRERRKIDRIDAHELVQQRTDRSEAPRLLREPRRNRPYEHPIGAEPPSARFGTSRWSGSARDRRRTVPRLEEQHPGKAAEIAGGETLQGTPPPP